MQGAMFYICSVVLSLRVFARVSVALSATQTHVCEVRCCFEHDNSLAVVHATSFLWTLLRLACGGKRFRQTCRIPPTSEIGWGRCLGCCCRLRRGYIYVTELAERVEHVIFVCIALVE